MGLILCAVAVIGTLNVADITLNLVLSSQKKEKTMTKRHMTEYVVSVLLGQSR